MSTLEFWGVRGSLPSPGPQTVRYGGNTSCAAVRTGADSLLVLDAGSGIRALSGSIGDVERIDVLITHLHMDHIQGLGFFTPLFQPGQEVHLWGPRSAEHRFQDRLVRYLSAPLFPVHLYDLPCKLWLHDVPLDEFEVADVRAAADLVCHPSPTVGYRLEVAGTTVTYLPDHEPALAGGCNGHGDEWRSGHALAAGADLLVHDAQYDGADYCQRVGWGHSSWDHAVDFARATGARTLVPFHFDPTYEDARLDALFQADGIDVLPAQEGLALDLDTAAVPSV